MSLASDLDGVFYAASSPEIILRVVRVHNDLFVNVFTMCDFCKAPFFLRFRKENWCYKYVTSNLNKEKQVQTAFNYVC
jgi:hypothetical protein